MFRLAGLQFDRQITDLDRPCEADSIGAGPFSGGESFQSESVVQRAQPNTIGTGGVQIVGQLRNPFVLRIQLDKSGEQSRSLSDRRREPPRV